MASQCKRQQCTFDRRGVRQELDSWRHKLIHCVGFESIIECLLDQKLLEDLKQFKDLEPSTVSDWSFDENCIFCCLRRDKVKEHLIGFSDEEFESRPKPVVVKDQTTISKLEEQAEEFLNAILCRKDVPNFSDPHIPVVAREILQRMIRQFAAEYTSKTSSPQDSPSDVQPHADQSLPSPSLLSGAPSSNSVGTRPAHNQNPVLSKLLMAAQDAPLDLTVKKPVAVPCSQDGVLDLSIKKNRHSNSPPARRSCLSPTTAALKGRSLKVDGQVGLLMRSLHDGRRRENVGHSASYKPSPSLAYSLRIKEEADLESSPESPLSQNRGSRPSKLYKNGSDFWNSKSHLGALLKLEANSEASERLKDIPKLLEAAGFLEKSLAFAKNSPPEACGENSLSLSHSPSFDLKIPQVRVFKTGTETSWDSLSNGNSGLLSENSFGKTFDSILPPPTKKKRGVSFITAGREKDCWPYDNDSQAFVGGYPLDSGSDLNSKQPRKKRGRYRQYNTELLEEAIVVVMDGKMSVSKAQSIYGIPHSTLEYKVKERLGTLKNPPKKRVKVMINQAEEQKMSPCPEGTEMQNSLHVVCGVKENRPEESDNGIHDEGLAENMDPNLSASKLKELQSASTLEEFMAKLCVHHQRQIVGAIGFLQTEVKTLASSSRGQQDRTSISDIRGRACSTAKYCAATTAKQCSEQRIPGEAIPKSEIQKVGSIPGSFAIKKDESAALLKPSVASGPAVDLCSPASNLPNTGGHHADHAPLKMKIMTSNVADGKKLSCVLTHSEASDDREGLSNSSGRVETLSARLSSSVKRHSHHTRHRDTLGHAKDRSTKMPSVHMTTPSASTRTARKTLRAPDHQIRDSVCLRPADPDLGHYDIVFIDKPITECFKERRQSMLPRRNARKSTRGHMFSDEIWELKTVRTLAGRGNCPNPMPELITLVTPKQILSKPEGLPPVDMPFAGACRKSLNQQMTTEESGESALPGTGDAVEVADGEVDVIVETSQTDLSQSKGLSVPPSPVRSLTTNQDPGKEDTAPESGTPSEKVDIVTQVPFIVENIAEPQEDQREGSEGTEALENIPTETTEPRLSKDPLSSDGVLLQNGTTLPVSPVDEVAEDDECGKIIKDQTQERQPDTLIQDSVGAMEETAGKGSSASEGAGGIVPVASDDNDDEDYDVSSKTLDALLKELPPWRRKKGTVISLPKRLRKAETVVVGYFNGRPISASDRSLRRRSGPSTTSPHKTPVKSNRNAHKTSTVDSKADHELSGTPLPETPLKSLESASVQQERESSPAAPKSPASICPSNVKQVQKNSKSAQREQSNQADGSEDVPRTTEPKRQLRSAAQKPAEAPVLPLKSNAVTPILAPPPEVLPPADHALVLPSASASPLRSCSAANEESHQDTVPVTTAEVDGDDTQSVRNPSEMEQEAGGNSRLLEEKEEEDEEGFVEDPAEECGSEEQQPVLKGSGPSEDLSQTMETEVQAPQLRSKRTLRKDFETAEDALPPKPASSENVSVSESENCASEKPRRMPLRSETSKMEISHQTVAELPVDKKLVLRSQRLAAPSVSAAAAAGKKVEAPSPIRIKPERTPKAQAKPSVAPESPQSSGVPVIALRSEPPKQTANKFFEILTGEESQHLITNLNMKYEKMQKGWVQMDKECPSVAKYRNRADRQAAIWKSKRRARKVKGLEHQKYSPVQMLFMKGFNLSSICRWFLESTETKSLVIVKKMNTRLPSEHQLCFHSSSSAAGSSQGLFPSLQAERLKKHLKKFAIASPVKSNPKSRKLIARALEQEATAAKSKEKRDVQSVPQSLSRSHHSEALVQTGEPQKSSGKTKNPASARILRKYSNIREKMQVQLSNGRLKEASKALRTHSMKRLTATKAAAKSNLKHSLKAEKSHAAIGKRLKPSAAKLDRGKPLSGKKAAKPPAQKKVAKDQSSGRVSREVLRKEPPKRSSQRLGSPKGSEIKLAEAPKIKQQMEKTDLDKLQTSQENIAKVQAKESTADAEMKGAENAGEAPPHTEVKVPQSPDQVLTRSQRKMEAAVPERLSKAARPTASSPKSLRKAEDSALTRSGAGKPPPKKSQGVSSLRSAAKSAVKRTQEPAETPAKRTRTSLAK